MTRPSIKQVDRLIARHVLAALAVTLVVLVAIDAMSALAREVDEFGEGDYSLATAVAFIALSLPRRAYEYFPFAAVIGTLVGLGGLAASAELTAMRAGGMSLLRIAGSALAAVGVATLLMVGVGETLAPGTPWSVLPATGLGPEANLEFGQVFHPPRPGQARTSSGGNPHGLRGAGRNL